MKLIKKQPNTFDIVYYTFFALVITIITMVFPPHTNFMFATFFAICMAMFLYLMNEGVTLVRVILLFIVTCYMLYIATWHFCYHNTWAAVATFVLCIIQSFTVLKEFRILRKEFLKQ
jgi:hypothetical protein